jgi:hypothetical protein
MKVAITKNIPQVEIIEIEFPYYYRYDLTAGYRNSVIYGKIEEKLCTSIQEKNHHDGKETYEVEKEEHCYIKNSGLSSYFDKEHNSSKEEFESVKARCLSFLSGC